MPNRRNTKDNGPNRNVAPDGHGDYGRAGVRVLDDPLSWGAVPAEALHAAVAAVTGCGDAVLFSRTADGGVLALQVFSGQQKHKFYPRTVDEADELLSEITATANLKRGANV